MIELNDNFLWGFLIATFLHAIVVPFFTGFFRRMYQDLWKREPKLDETELGKALNDWLIGHSARLAALLYGRMRAIAKDVWTALEENESKPPNEQINFRGRLLLEEIADRLKVRLPKRSDPCQNCGGDGLAACPACHGDGEQPNVPAPIPVNVDTLRMPEHIDTPVLQSCDRCNGTGYEVPPDADGKAKTCETCKGRGQAFGAIREKFTDPPDRMTCPLCNGTGRADRVPSVSNVGNPCGTCDGKGVVDSGAPGPDDQWIEVPCPDCDGHGCDFVHVDDGAPAPPDCARCDGTGKVEAFGPHDDERPATVGMHGGLCLLEEDPADRRAGIEAATRRARGERDPCPECDGTGKRKAE